MASIRAFGRCGVAKLAGLSWNSSSASILSSEKRIIPKIRTLNSFDFAHDGVEVLLALRPGVSAVKAFAGIDAGLVAVVVANQAS